MSFNYQVLTNKTKDGRYIPDYDKLIENASCQEEIDYIKSVQERQALYAEKNPSYLGFAFNFVYVMKQKCGHYEIFQHPGYGISYILDEIREHAEYHAADMKCTRCTCNW